MGGSPPLQEKHDVINILSQESQEEDAKENQKDAVVIFEPFEPGNIWTQKQPTQFQRKQWRKRVYMDDEEEDDNVGGAAILTTQANARSAAQGRSDDEIRVGGGQQQQQPWWENGKTAPLLNDFDSDRRSFYLAQAGLATSSDNNIIAEQENDTSHSHLARTVVIERPTVSRQNPLQQLQQVSPTIVTPGKKTWNAVWGQNGLRSGPTSDQKKKLASPFKTPSRTTPSSSRGSARGRASKRGGRKTT
jgi:hypothetical protein